MNRTKYPIECRAIRRDGKLIKKLSLVVGKQRWSSKANLILSARVTANAYFRYLFYKLESELLRPRNPILFIVYWYIRVTYTYGALFVVQKVREMPPSMSIEQKHEGKYGYQDLGRAIPLKGIYSLCRLLIATIICVYPYYIESLPAPRAQKRLGCAAMWVGNELSKEEETD